MYHFFFLSAMKYLWPLLLCAPYEFPRYILMIFESLLSLIKKVCHLQICKLMFRYLRLFSPDDTKSLKVVLSTTFEPWVFFFSIYLVDMLIYLRMCEGIQLLLFSSAYLP